MTRALIIATGRTADGPDPGPTAALPYGADPEAPTLLTRLCHRLVTLNVPDLYVITRPDLAPQLRKDGHDVIECTDLAADLREIARLVRAPAGPDDRGVPIVLLPGDLVASDELLCRLIIDARGPATAITTPLPTAPGTPNAPDTDHGTTNATRSGNTSNDDDVGGGGASGGRGVRGGSVGGGASGGGLGYGVAAVRLDGGRVASAGSPFHLVTGADAGSPGALRVGRRHAAAFAALAERLAALVDGPGASRRPGAGPGALRRFGAGRHRAAEAAELLLVGLVRTGVPVRACPAGPLACLRVGGEAAALAARRAVEAVDENRVRLAAAVKPDDAPFATYAVSTYSPHLVRWAAWWGLSPNAVTSVSAGTGLLAAVWFSDGTRTGMIAGALLLYTSFVLDCVDGQLARYTRAESAFGAWLDVLSDRVKESAVYAGLAVGALAAAPGSPVYAGDVWGLAVAAVALLAVRHLADLSFAARHRPRAVGPPASFPLTARPDGALVGRLPAAVRLSRRTSRSAVLHRLKKAVVLPVGERFALISVTAAVGDARLTFTALIAWGAVAAAYTVTGRVMRSVPR
ncbi:CDP-alcohol phosphatidyltransferase family protein [Actinomadura fibrosa]|uniref:CDP-alcohol phosphatidyltransferase family protein n=1 Tax=Actinomadura fibrosa TaxID=111802 RepID=A0ABW2XG04_9ACTN|nr:CDP-alcohol phosphatidyltransferase family protein [Actinomadura fibrosa]